MSSLTEFEYGVGSGDAALALAVRLAYLQIKDPKSSNYLPKYLLNRSFGGLTLDPYDDARLPLPGKVLNYITVVLDKVVIEGLSNCLPAAAPIVKGETVSCTFETGADPNFQQNVDLRSGITMALAGNTYEGTLTATMQRATLAFSITVGTVRDLFKTTVNSAVLSTESLKASITLGKDSSSDWARFLEHIIGSPAVSAKIVAGINKALRCGPTLHSIETIIDQQLNGA